MTFSFLSTFWIGSLFDALIKMINNDRQNTLSKDYSQVKILTKKNSELAKFVPC